MKPNNVLYIVFAAIFFTSCGSAKIITPQNGDAQKSPFDVVVEHSGCGTLRVFLDHNTPKEREITGLLKYRNGQYVAEKVEAAPWGTHEINAFLEKNPGQRCFTSGQICTFDVVGPVTCVSGKVTFQGRCTVDPSSTRIKIYKSQSNTIMASGLVDGNGNFCVAFTPNAEKVDVEFSNTALRGCMGYLKLENIEITSSVDLSCSKNNCKTLGEISIQVAPAK